MTTRFWSKVRKTRSCWYWMAATNNCGYGMYHAGDKVMTAHKMSFIHHHGPVPEGLEIHHTCARRNCVNPKHLVAITHAANVRLARRAA